MSFRPRWRVCQDCGARMVQNSPRQVHCFACRFWALVDVRGDDECWPWTGALNEKGYGEFGEDGTSLHAHVVAWELANKKSRGQKRETRHSCHNKPCCNPRHLKEGSTLENMLDSIEVGAYRPFGRTYKC